MEWENDSIIEIADALNAGIAVKDITFIEGTVYKTKNRDIIYDAIELPDYDEIKENKRSLCTEFLQTVLQYRSVFRQAFV